MTKHAILVTFALVTTVLITTTPGGLSAAVSSKSADDYVAYLIGFCFARSTAAASELQLCSLETAKSLVTDAWAKCKGR